MSQTSEQTPGRRHDAEGGISTPGVDSVEDGRQKERADVLAYLARRAANARTVADWARRGGGHDELAEDRRRQLEVIHDELMHRLHEGEAEKALDFPRGADSSRGWPYTDHRSLAEVDADEAAGGISAPGNQNADNI